MMMKAMILEAPGKPLVLREIPVPQPAVGEILLRVEACAVCRTDLHIQDGELEGATLPLIPGHEIVGIVEASGSPSRRFHPGDRLGVPWLGSTCGSCQYCHADHENLCDQARFTGFHIPGGYAEYTIVKQDFVYRLPGNRPAVDLAPLLCAGLIGYRSWRLAGSGKHLGLYGFGAAAHIVIQLARYAGQEVYAFTRPGDAESQEFALGLGAAWAGGSDESTPTLLDSSIIFAPVGALVPVALEQVCKGGTVVCGGIHMSEIPAFPYQILWGERVLRSVANLTRRDGEEFLPLAARIPVRTETTSYPLHQANEALEALRRGRLKGAAVLTMN